MGISLTKLQIMNKYRIVRWERYDKKGELKDTYFYVEKSFKILRWTFWKYVRENTASTSTLSGAPARNRMKFKFITDAQHFIEEILVQNKPYDKEITKVMEVY